MPAIWYKAIEFLILKHGKSTIETRSYRPISLTSILAKIADKMVVSVPSRGK